MSTDRTGPVAVVGAGQMGAGIAQAAATAGYSVTLHDTVPAALDRARESMRWSTDKLVAKGRLTRAAAEATLDRVELTDELADCRTAQLVVEAVDEDLATKQQVFARLDELCGPEVVLATNTSALPIGRIAAATSNPGRVVGTHFFTPVALMELCELVRGPATTDATLAHARTFAEACGKTCIVVERDAAGFVATRLAVVLALEAARLVESGLASPADVDAACRLGLGHSMGPLETADLSGLDVLLHAAATIHAETGVAAFDAPDLVRGLVEAGRLGRKSGRGFHPYAG